MNTYFIFSDECGSYAKSRSSRFNNKHPFYIRSNVIMSVNKYRQFERDVLTLNQKYTFPEYGEVKWSFLGDIYNKRPPKGFESIKLKILQSYIREVINLACQTGVLFIFTVTDNNEKINVEEISLIKWHVQYALQRIQMDLVKKDGYGIFILDDLNDKNKRINSTIYLQMCSGDFVTYENIKKSILIDYSHQCSGLQLADLAAGIFANTLRRIRNSDKSYNFAWKVFTEMLQFNIRDSSSMRNSLANPWITNGYGIISIPSKNCNKLINSVSNIIENIRLEDLHKGYYDSSNYL